MEAATSAQLASTTSAPYDCGRCSTRAYAAKPPGTMAVTPLPNGASRGPIQSAGDTSVQWVSRFSAVRQSPVAEAVRGQVPVMCSGRTGTRLRSSPQAWRIAASTAGPDEIVGASPTPRTPYGAFGSAYSSTSMGIGGTSRIVGIR